MDIYAIMFKNNRMWTDVLFGNLNVIVIYAALMTLQDSQDVGEQMLLQFGQKALQNTV